MAREKVSKSKVPPKKGLSADTSAATPPPSWPNFKPALPVAHLELTPINPEFAEQITVVRSFFPKSLCRDYVSFLQGLPLTTTPGRPKRGEATRVNDRYQVDDPAFAQRLWEKTGLKELVLDEGVKHLWGGEVVGLNPNIRVYRYSKNQFFDCHYDDSNMVALALEPTGTVNTKTTWTLLLYLTSAAEGCVGGETVFYPEDRKGPKEEIAVALETGMLLLHKHGKDCLLHEGREVTSGEKWVLRSDLCVRR